MATLRGWAIKLHLAKPHPAKIVSRGFTFGGVLTKPAELYFVFERADKGQVEVMLSPQEAEEVRLACVEFNQRRGG